MAESSTLAILEEIRSFVSDRLQVVSPIFSIYRFNVYVDEVSTFGFSEL